MLCFCRELVSRLQERGVQVFLISGGFRSIVEHVAARLSIPAANVFANRLKFYFNGELPGGRPVPCALPLSARRCLGTDLSRAACETSESSTD